MPDLFDWIPSATYPQRPGFKEKTTSSDAARAIEPIARTLRDQVLMILRAAWPGGLTADEIASKMGRSVLSVRPRVSELRKMREIFPTFDADGHIRTRTNESGIKAAIVVCKRPEGQ